jgi:hypothetical protein
MDASLGYAALIGGMAIGTIIVPGPIVNGQTFHQGVPPLTYKINGLKMFCLAIFTFLGLSFTHVIRGEFFA